MFVLLLCFCYHKEMSKHVFLVFDRAVDLLEMKAGGTKYGIPTRMLGLRERYVYREQHFILSSVGHVLQRQTVTEEPISPEERLGICLYRLGRGDYYYTIAEMVGRGVATVSSIVQEVCSVLVEYLWTEIISSNMPKSREDFEEKILDMEELWQFPCCWMPHTYKMSTWRP